MRLPITFCVVALALGLLPHGSNGAGSNPQKSDLESPTDQEEDTGYMASMYGKLPAYEPGSYFSNLFFKVASTAGELTGLKAPAKSEGDSGSGIMGTGPEAGKLTGNGAQEKSEEDSGRGRMGTRPEAGKLTGNSVQEKSEEDSSSERMGTRPEAGKLTGMRDASDVVVVDPKAESDKSSSSSNIGRSSSSSSGSSSSSSSSSSNIGGSSNNSSKGSHTNKSRDAEQDVKNNKRGTEERKNKEKHTTKATDVSTMENPTDVKVIVAPRSVAKGNQVDKEKQQDNAALLPQTKSDRKLEPAARYHGNGMMADEPEAEEIATSCVLEWKSTGWGGVGHCRLYCTGENPFVTETMEEGCRLEWSYEEVVCVVACPDKKNSSTSGEDSNSNCTIEGSSADGCALSCPTKESTLASTIERGCRLEWSDLDRACGVNCTQRAELAEEARTKAPPPSSSTTVVAMTTKANSSIGTPPDGTTSRAPASGGNTDTTTPGRTDDITEETTKIVDVTEASTTTVDVTETNTKTDGVTKPTTKIVDVTERSTQMDDVTVAKTYDATLQNTASYGVTVPRNGGTVDTSKHAVYQMKAKYHTCDNCMVRLNSSLTQCPYYATHALEFDKWAKEYSEVLRFGCHAQGITQQPRCCHASLKVVGDTINQMAYLAQTLTQNLKDQCNKCPVDCEWDEWSDWSVCSANTCEGRGVSRRTRTRAARKEQFGGRACYGRRVETETCPVIKRVIGVWHEWGAWSSCSGSCTGARSRIRTCTNPTVCFEPCRGDSVEVERCGDPMLCCRYYTWTEWGNWEQCLDDGVKGSLKRTQKRHRKCQADPAYPTRPICAGGVCPRGPEEEERPCQDKCAKCVDREWTGWSEWGACYYANGNHGNQTVNQVVQQTRTRYRKCEGNPRFPREPMCPDPCPGRDTEREDCCIPSVWSLWGEWTPCTELDGSVDLDSGEPCGPGIGCQNRTRTCLKGTCDDFCVGDAIDHNLHCNLKPCCEPPVLTQWGEWEECLQHDRRSGRSIQKRRRQCQPNPDKWAFPACKRTPCNGALVEDKPCTIIDCEPTCEDPSWKSWSSWGRCDFRRSPYLRTRTRDCHNPSAGEPACPRTNCLGSSTGQEVCECVRDSWSSWSPWSSCFPTADPDSVQGSGEVGGTRDSTFSGGRRTRTRERQCISDWNSPDYCGDAPPPWRQCIGKDTDEEICCEEPSWRDWSPWSQCDFRRSPSLRTRTRDCHNPSAGYPACSLKECVGSSKVVETCACEPVASWATWGAWTACQPTIYGGLERARTRVCEWLPGCLPTDNRQPRCLVGRYSQRERCAVVTTTTTTTAMPMPVTMNECVGRKQGTFPSKRRGCNTYVVCCNGIVTSHVCRDDQVFDSVCQACGPTSRTCNRSTGLYDIYRDSADLKFSTNWDKSYCTQTAATHHSHKRNRRLRNRTRASSRRPLFLK